MASPLEVAVVAGVAIATVNAFFAWRDGRPPIGVARTFAAWFLAFVVAGLIAQPVAVWLLTHVF